MSHVRWIFFSICTHIHAYTYTHIHIHMYLRSKILGGYD